MKRILILGAGKSSPYAIDRLAEWCAERDGKLTVADLNGDLAKARCAKHRAASAAELSSADPAAREALIAAHDIVVSLLPATEHPAVAQQCLRYGRHLVTASYVTPAMESLHKEAVQAGLIFLNECGVDPGLDHISAMMLLDRIRQEGGTVVSFKSACGGLVAPESDTNPWGYKFTWNPRNVVLAGQGGAALYREEGQIRLCPAHRLFAMAHRVEIEGVGTFELYANRDSLLYAPLYGLEGCPTFLRGTLRRSPFCRAWHMVLSAGLTDDTTPLPWLRGEPRFRLMQTLGFSSLSEVLKLHSFGESQEVVEALEFLELFSSEPLMAEGLPTAAGYLQKILEEKWRLRPNDRDRVVLVHQIIWQRGGRRYGLISSLVEDGRDALYTAMARTVGLTLAEATILVAEGRLRSCGVLRPTLPELYEPLWEKLVASGVFKFKDTEVEIS
ncbi:MAG: saccharopine dehydrogenase NADP-binding domain-containing protein [Flavobacteriales bacterium]|nr:saccharopine dehydrogenase NADP-binding domain-containing protein [Flavobacteriales bacterium]MCX7767647.1 saccharopine dehydrogenase NADP-binding domain-containing protein [Flavobacteriales bacterium]MDW8409511.1 saccharopine dehydrogenase C-terminal domain-containing protein [Flavobacteriales bacterium]